MNDLYLGNPYEIDDFKSIVERRRKISEHALNALSNAIRKATLIKDSCNQEEPETRFIVNMTDDIKAALKNGDIKLDFNKKTGEMYAQLRENNRYGKKLSIREELVETGVSPEDIVVANQLQTIEEHFEQVIDALENIGQSIESILQGQENDRIAMYYSGQRLYFEAKNIQDNILRKYIISQAVQSLSEANAKMALQIKGDIKFLLDKEYTQKKGKSLKAIDEKIQSINKAFEIIFRSAVLRAGIYYEQNEFLAMMNVIDDLGQFMSQLILPNASKLIEYDDSISCFRGSAWEKRVDSLLEMRDLKDNLLDAKVFYIETKENEYVQR